MMRSMALASARTRYLVLVLKLANTGAKRRTACGTELVAWFALCLGRSPTVLLVLIPHTECQVVCFIFAPFVRQAPVLLPLRENFACTHVFENKALKCPSL